MMGSTAPVDDRFAQAVAAIDRANADDPHTIVVAGVEQPKELAHAELMTAWVRRLDPDASVEQLLAARAHHLRRWTVPRQSYPEGRGGYLRWRTALRNQHGDDVARILMAAGYEADVVDRVRQIVRKENLRSDPAVQTHEDALCLVFLATQLEGVAEQLGDEKTVEVLAKTLAKMSDRGIDFALTLPLSELGRRLLDQAVAHGQATYGDAANRERRRKP
jgi:hypothetical protein